MKKEERGREYRDLSGLSKEELLSLIENAKRILHDQHLLQEPGLLPPQDTEGIPIEVFATDLSPSEAAVKWLKEQGLGYHDIGARLNRDERGVWGSYRRASKKMPAQFSIDTPQAIIPFSVLSNRKVAMLEAITYYLKESRNIKLIMIAQMLHKHPSTIWTVYNRAVKKLRGNDEKH